MPIIKSALKKLRQGKKRSAQNLALKQDLKEILDSFKKKPTAAAMTKVFSALDKAAKRNLLHPHKAARLKSRLSKLMASKK